MKIRTDPRTGMKYADYMLGGKRHRVSLGTKNNEIAIVKAGKLADNKKMRDTGRIAFEAFLQRYRDYLKATHRPKSIAKFEIALKRFLSFRRVQFLDEITPALLDECAIFYKSKLLSDCL